MHTIYFSFYHVIIFLGIFQGFLLGYIFIFNKKFRKKSNIALAIAVLSLSLSGIVEITQSLNLQINYLKFIPLGHLSLGALGLYYFVVFLLNPDYKFNKKDYWIMAPVGIMIFLKISLYLLNLWHPIIIETRANIFYIFNIIVNFFPIFYLVGSLIGQLKLVNNYHRQLFDNFSEVTGKKLYWLKNLIYFLFIFAGIWTLVMVGIIIIGKRSSIFPLLWIVTCGILCWLAYFVILRRDVFAIPIFKNQSDTTEKQTLSDKTDEHYQKLLQLMQEEKLYHDAELSMDTLAEKTQLSNGYLSRIINQKEGKNFYDFVNSYRVAEVKANLNHPDFAHYSILGIGLEAGFKSKSTFNAVFKKMTGMTPSAYKKTMI